MWTTRRTDDHGRPPSYSVLIRPATTYHSRAPFLILCAITTNECDTFARRRYRFFPARLSPLGRRQKRGIRQTRVPIDIEICVKRLRRVGFPIDQAIKVSSSLHLRGGG